MQYENKNVTMENVRIVFRNFAGREGMYNREGDRNFAVLLDDDLADAMASDGWNIKRLKPRENDEDPHAQPYLQVSVNFKGRPPRVILVTSRGRNTLGEDEVEVLDWVDIANVDLTIRPYEWAVNGKTGVKAYLQTIFVTIDEDPLELKYQNIEEVRALPGRKKRMEIEAAQDPNVVDAELVDEDDD